MNGNGRGGSPDRQARHTWSIVAWVSGWKEYNTGDYREKAAGVARNDRGWPLAGNSHMHFETEGAVFKSKISDLRQLVIVNASGLACAGGWPPLPSGEGRRASRLWFSGSEVIGR